MSPTDNQQHHSHKRWPESSGKDDGSKKKPKRPLSAYRYFVVEESKRILGKIRPGELLNLISQHRRDFEDDKRRTPRGELMRPGELLKRHISGESAAADSTGSFRLLPPKRLQTIVETEMLSLISRNWQELQDDNRRIYEERAAADFERYRRELSAMSCEDIEQDTEGQCKNTGDEADNDSKAAWGEAVDMAGKRSNDSCESAASYPTGNATSASQSTPKPPPAAPASTTDTSEKGSSDSSQSATTFPMAKSVVHSHCTSKAPQSSPVVPVGTAETKRKGRSDSSQSAAASPTAKSTAESQRTPKAPPSPPAAPACTIEMTGRGSSDSTQSHPSQNPPSARPAERVQVPARRPLSRPACPTRKRKSRATPISSPERGPSTPSTGAKVIPNANANVDRPAKKSKVKAGSLGSVGVGAKCARSSPGESSAWHSTGTNCKSADNQAQRVRPRAATVESSTSPRRSPAAGVRPQKAARPSSKRPSKRQGGGNRPNVNLSAKWKKNQEKWREQLRDHYKSKADEQERLFREAAQRVKTNLGHNKGADTAPRFRVVSGVEKQMQSPSFKHPVEDVSSLPAEHWRWTDPFARLGLPKSSGLAMIKRNYRRLALLYHPDKVQAGRADVGEEGDIHARFHAIKDAFEVLSRGGK